MDEPNLRELITRTCSDIPESSLEGMLAGVIVDEVRHAPGFTAWICDMPYKGRYYLLIEADADEGLFAVELKGEADRNFWRRLFPLDEEAVEAPTDVEAPIEPQGDRGERAPELVPTPTPTAHQRNYRLEWAPRQPSRNLSALRHSEVIDWPTTPLPASTGMVITPEQLRRVREYLIDQVTATPGETPQADPQQEEDNPR